MQGDIAISVIMSPIGVMLAGAAIAAVMSVRAWASVYETGEKDALAGLFERETLQDQLSDPKLRHIRARGLRRTTSLHRSRDRADRERSLHAIAVVMRGGERDPFVVRAASRYLEGEGFIIVDYGAGSPPPDTSIEIAEFSDLEEVKLLPPPPGAQAA